MYGRNRMAFDSWENVGYKIIDKINSFETILLDMKDDIQETKTALSTIQIKMWGISIFIGTVVTIMIKFLDI
jgi:hypothetical protein